MGLELSEGRCSKTSEAGVQEQAITTSSNWPARPNFKEKPLQYE